MTLATINYAAFSQKINASKVPAVVKNTFEKQYPSTTVTWEKENGKYEAAFIKNGTSMSALYEINGTLAETEIEIKVTALPAAIIKYVKENYKQSAIKSAAKITLANGTTNYEAALAGKDLIFDENGKFLREVKEK